MKNQNNKKLDIKKLSLIAAVAVALLIMASNFINPGKSDQEGKTPGNIPVAKDSDIVINTKDISDTPSYYPAKINGTDLEIIAVKASDGTIRTAFNTCQVCYSSGRGYYKMEGNKLVCQNCGNRFGVDDIEVVRGGCNPVPITQEYKAVSDDTITISKDFLKQATVIFANWKTNS